MVNIAILKPYNSLKQTKSRYSLIIFPYIKLGHQLVI